MHLFADGAVAGIVYAAHCSGVIFRHGNEVWTTGHIGSPQVENMGNITFRTGWKRVSYSRSDSTLYSRLP